MTKQAKTYLREQYHLLIYLLNMQKNNGILVDKIDLFNDDIKEMKKRIRNINHKNNKLPYGAYQYTVLNTGYDDSFLTKTVFDYVFDEEEKQEYIKENWARCISPYDCSGEIFTQDIKIFTTKNKTFIYEWSAINI